MPREPHHSKNWGGARRKASPDPAVKFTVSLPQSLFDEINKRSYRADGLSRSQVIAKLLRKALKEDVK